MKQENLLLCICVGICSYSTCFADAPPLYQAGEESPFRLANPEQCTLAKQDETPHLTVAISQDAYDDIPMLLSLEKGADPVPVPSGGFLLEVTFLDAGAGFTSLSLRRGGSALWESPRRSSGYTRLNTGAERSAWFAFPDGPALTPGAAVQIHGLQQLRALRLLPLPDDAAWATHAAAVPKKVSPMVTLKRPMQLVTTAGVDVRGGMATLEASLTALNDLAPLARVLGFTSIESYVTWKRLEPEAEGRFDFSYYDAVTEKLGEYGLKWFPLLIVGSAYALPEWFLESAENVGMVCLEHGLSNPVQSIAYPGHRRHVTRVLEAFGAHYEAMGVLEGVRLGPSGNYGESQYPAGGNWGVEGRAMHIHIGWWAGDEHAKSDYRRFLTERYRGAAAMSVAWGLEFASIADVPMTLPTHMLTKRQRLDFTEWYTGLMSQWCAWWGEEARRALPKTPIYQSAGGWGFRESGTDYTAQTKDMAAIKGGVRLTNETDSFEQNFYVTRLAATAARLYGVGLGYEPASSHTARGVAGRIFNTATTNGDHFFTYHSNIMGHPLAIQQWLEYAPMLDERRPPLVEVAVYYPETFNQIDDSTFRHLYASGFYPRAAAVRRVVDVDYLDERLIRDGYLERYKALVFVWGNVIEPDVLKLIDTWVREGGVLIYPSFPRGPLETVEGDSAVFQRWASGEAGKGAMHRFKGDMEPPSLYGAFTERVLREMKGLSPPVRAVLEAERPEGVFLTAHEGSRVMALNYGDAEARVKVGSAPETRIPPYGIRLIAPGG